MRKESLEHLSSLMDGELSRDTGLFMTRRLGSDSELSMAWKRYHLIRDCIRQPGGNMAIRGFSDCVRDALEAEAEAPVMSMARKRWIRPVSGFAIAASVALLAIVAIGPGQPVGDPASSLAEDAASQPFTSPNPLPAVPVSQPASFNPNDRAVRRTVDPRLNSYLVRHNQVAGTAGRQGFVSFVPIIAVQAGASDRETPGELADGNPAPGEETPAVTTDSP